MLVEVYVHGQQACRSIARFKSIGASLHESSSQVGGVRKSTNRAAVNLLADSAAATRICCSKVLTALDAMSCPIASCIQRKHTVLTV